MRWVKEITVSGRFIYTARKKDAYVFTDANLVDLYCDANRQEGCALHATVVATGYIVYQLKRYGYDTVYKGSVSGSNATPGNMLDRRAE